MELEKNFRDLLLEELYSENNISLSLSLSLFTYVYPDISKPISVIAIFIIA